MDFVLLLYLLFFGVPAFFIIRLILAVIRWLNRH